MSFWATATKTQKTITLVSSSIIGLGVIFGATWKGYDHFATKAYSDSGDTEIKDEMHETHDDQIVAANRAEIWRARREINRIKEQQFELEETTPKYKRLQADVDQYDKLIDCIKDPEQKLCYD